MTDLTQVIRWNTGFVRGLAQSVLERAKVVRSTLTGYSAGADSPKAAAASKTGKRPAKKTSTAKKAAPKARKAASKAGRGKKILHG